MLTLREAARALLNDWEQGWPDHEIYPERMGALRAALAAPPPAPDELRRKLVELWLAGCDEYDAPGKDPEGERDRLIAEIREMWSRRNDTKQQGVGTHTGQSKPCPTCGFPLREGERVPFQFEE